jgi:hypothetical protein
MKIITKHFLILLLLSICISSLLAWGRHTLKRELPKKIEAELLNRFAAENTLLSLSSHPRDNYIHWDRDDRYSGEMSLKIAIDSVEKEVSYCSDITLREPVDLQAAYQEGSLEFWIKTTTLFPVHTEFEALLVDAGGTRLNSAVSWDKGNNTWQFVALPLRNFSPPSVPGSFDWRAVKRIEFAVRCPQNSPQITLLIDELKIKHAQKVLLDICALFE